MRLTEGGRRVRIVSRGPASVIGVSVCGLLLAGCSALTGAGGSTGATGAGAKVAAAAVQAVNPELKKLYVNLINACESDPEMCTSSPIAGDDESVTNAAAAFCGRFIHDAQAVFLASGLITKPENQQSYGYMPSFESVNLDDDVSNTTQGGDVDPYNKDAGCVSPTNPGGFALWLAQEPATLNNTDFGGVSRQPFGHPCVSSVSDQFSEPSLDLACISGNGWAFDVVEAQKSAIPAAALEQAFDEITRDL